MSTRSVKRRVEPLEHVVRPEGHVARGKQNEASACLVHVVRPEGHTTRGKQNEVSGTLRAPSAS
jgi:hypothetical protein